jgi:deoxyadenosine/deoxycytidine kinase
MKLFTIEGNIGSGKSTFIKELKKNLKHIDGVPVIYVPEPVEEWESIQSLDGKNMIELFYQDQPKYAFSFQMMAYITRLNILQKEIKKYPNCILISERSLLADYHVFAKMLYEEGHISHENYQIYKRWFYSFLDNIKIDGIIYLVTNPSVCFDRCSIRSRKGENTISLEYLTRCWEMHERWMDDEDIPVEGLCDNTENEVEVVKAFIKQEIKESNHISYHSYEVEQIAAVFCIGIVVVGYIFRFISIFQELS